MYKSRRKEAKYIEQKNSWTQTPAHSLEWKRDNHQYKMDMQDKYNNMGIKIWKNDNLKKIQMLT